MAHVLLPAIGKNESVQNPYKYANRAVPAMLEAMLKAGAVRHRVWAKIAGGSQMFKTLLPDQTYVIGDKNVEAVKLVLEILKIPLIAEDTGGEYGRTMTAELNEGAVQLKVLGKEMLIL